MKAEVMKNVLCPQPLPSPSVPFLPWPSNCGNQAVLTPVPRDGDSRTD